MIKSKKASSADSWATVERRRAIVTRLATEFERGSLKEHGSEAQHEHIAVIFREEGATFADFQELDERSGLYTGRFGFDWFARLRHARNHAPNFFENLIRQRAAERRRAWRAGRPVHD